MGDRKRLVLLILVMASVAIIVGATALGAFYQAAFEREAQRLANFADSQARLIIALGPGRRSEILEEQRRLREKAAGSTAELQLARRDGDLIIFVTPARNSDHPAASVPLGGPLAEPMSRALTGQSGTMIGRDYAGHRVLAAYETVPALDLGLVAKIDMAEINGRYLRAGLIAGLVSLAMVSGAALLFVRLGEPMIRRLRESEERYRILVEAQPDPICQFRPDTTLIFVNRAYADFYGHEPEELIGKRWLDFAEQDGRPPFLDELASFTPEHPEKHEETRSTGADQEVRWFLCHIHSFFDRAGRIVSFQTFGTDITARKRAQEQLARQLALLTAITDSAADAIFVSDSQERVTLMNPAAERIFGWSPAELIGQKLHDILHRTYPDGRVFPASECPLRHVYTTGETLTGHEDVFFRKDGSPIPVACSNAPLVIEGRLAGAILVCRDITGQKAAEQALRTSEARLRKLIEAAPVAIAMFDRDMRYLAASGRFCSDYGLDDATDLVGRSLYDVFPDLPERWREVHQRCLAGAVERSDGERFDGRDGHSEWIRWEIQPWRSGDGEIGGIVLFSEDISARKQTEEALRLSNARYRTAGEAIRYGVWTCGPDGGVEFVSETFLDLIGKTLEQVRPRGWLDRLPPEDLRPTLDAWRKCVRTGADWSWEHRVQGVDGLYRTILSLGRPVRDEQGRVTSWVGFNLDISERKRAEDALRESEARLRGTFENAAVGISHIGMDGTWLRVNQRLCDIVGYGRDELLQKNFQQLTHPEDLPFTLDRFNALLRGEVESYHLEKRYIHKNGRSIWVNLTSALQRDEAGNPTYCITIIEDISARKQTEFALRESEVRLRRTVEDAPFPIMVHAEDGEIVHLSRSWLELTGYAREDIATIAAWSERAYGERHQASGAGTGQLAAPPYLAGDGERLIRTADGRTRFWTFSSAPLGRDDRGRRLVVSMAADVTERKEAERALRDSEVRMRAILDASEDEILLLSTHGEVLAINKAAERRLARQAGGADLVGSCLDRLLPRDQAESRMAIVRQVAKTSTLVHCDTQIRARWFEFGFYPVLKAGSPVSEVAVYAREITQQKKSQADLSKLFQAVQQSPMSVVITDCNGAIEYVNPEFTKVTGYTLAEAVNQNPRVLKSGHTPPEIYADLWATISAGGTWRGELLNKKKNGELYWELASIAPVKNAGNITNYIAVKEDITNRREMEEQLRQSQKMQAIGQLTGGIAHDFNNLLGIILGNLQLLSDRLGHRDAKVSEYLHDALWSARRGAELTHRLLAFARKQPLKPAVIDLNDVVRGMTDLLRRTLGAQIRIEEILASNLWKAVADRGELERAVVNLAVNARDATKGAGTLTLATRNVLLDQDYTEQYEEVTPGEYVLLAITDNGVGMSPEIIQHVFEPFFTTKGVGEGSGLGLSMVYGFVKQSGGHVSVYSRLGYGTSVKLYLPRVPSATGERADDPSGAAAAVFPDSLILVVEDEPKLRKVAVKMLERLGLRSIQAENAKEALALLTSVRPDVLFTDVELPGGMNGTALAEAVRQIDPGIKVLFTTGYAREGVVHDKWPGEKTLWLLKPYSYLDLAGKLKALLVPKAP